MNDPKTILSLVLNNIPQGVFWKDRNSIYLGCNQVISQAVGLNSPDDLVGKSDFDFPSLTAEQAAHFVDSDREVIESGVPKFAIVEPLTRFDGQTIWIETIKVPLRDENGQIIGVLGTWQDVTQRQQSEDALRHSEQRYRSLITATAQMVWISNARGSQLQVTPPLEEFTGLPADQMRGSGWLRAVHPEDRSRAEQEWNAAVSGVRQYECEFRLRRHDGEWRLIHSRGIPLLDSTGEICEWVGIGVDITERRLAELRVQKLNDELEQRVRDRTAELEAANKELEAFSYSVSHDLRAPLRAIDGFSRIVIDDFGDKLPPEALDYLVDVRASTKTMGQLISDLLSFSRLSRSPIKRQKIHPADLVERCLEELQDRRHDERACVTVGDLPDCSADPTLLKQVWMNLIGNAMKYSAKRDQPSLEIGSIPADGPGERIYYVKDNGVGFDMRYAHKLFGVFQRLHRAEEYEGTGVGLAIVQRIVHRHGGRVWAEGKPDAGATFYFALPEHRELP